MNNRDWPIPEPYLKRDKHEIEARKLIAYEAATRKFILHGDRSGYQELEALANNRVRPKETDESYLSWLSRQLAGLSDAEWESVKRIREA